MIESNSTISTYDDIAVEYYDPLLHPTCANFAELSNAYLASRIRRFVRRTRRTLETGAGRSTVAPVIQELGFPLEQLTLLDRSAEMLNYSLQWAHLGAHLIVNDACQTKLPSESFGLIVSGLGDPYNCQVFWHEVARLLVAGGICLFTMPAPEWAMLFRSPHTRSYAEFKIQGRTILVPSHIPSRDQQNSMIIDAGLRVIDDNSFLASDLSGPLSPKLLVSDDMKRLPIVRGFAVTRQRGG